MIRGRDLEGINVVFFVEHVDRELDAAVAIAEELQSRGISSAILSVYFHTDLLLRGRTSADVYVFPYLMGPHDWPIRMVRELYDHAPQYVNLNWEQRLAPVNRAHKRPKTPFQREHVHQYAWTSDFAELLRESGVAAERITVTGNVAEDLLARSLKMRPTLRRELSEVHGLRPEVPWVFFPMNYGWAFHSDRQIQAKIDGGYDRDIAYEYRAYSARCLATFLAWLATAAQELTEHELILRPHPSIMPAQYRERFDALDIGLPSNLTITKDRSVREWLPASDGVVSSWSTVAWDAQQIGIPAALVTPEPRPDWLDAEFMRELPSLISEPAFVDALRSCVLRTDRDLNHRPQGAVQRTADAILKLTATSTVRGSRRHLRRLSLSSAVKSLRGRVREFTLRRAFLRGWTTDSLLPDLFEPLLFSSSAEERGQSRVAGGQGG